MSAGIQSIRGYDVYMPVKGKPEADKSLRNKIGVIVETGAVRFRSFLSPWAMKMDDADMQYPSSSSALDFSFLFSLVSCLLSISSHLCISDSGILWTRLFQDCSRLTLKFYRRDSHFMRKKGLKNINKVW